MKPSCPVCQERLAMLSVGSGAREVTFLCRNPDCWIISVQGAIECAS